MDRSVKQMENHTYHRSSLYLRTDRLAHHASARRRLPCLLGSLILHMPPPHRMLCRKAPDRPCPGVLLSNMSSHHNYQPHPHHDVSLSHKYMGGRHLQRRVQRNRVRITSVFEVSFHHSREHLDLGWTRGCMERLGESVY